MDSRQLRYFIAVYEQRNLSRAADQANVAQSALSHHISNLEAEFATPLFERKPRGMEPTAAGERLYEHARIILRAMAEAETEVREGALSAGVDAVFDKSLQLEAFYDFCKTLNISPRR